MKVQERKLYIDMWCYELPLNALTEKDCMHANEDYNLTWQHNYLEDADYLIGTWNAITKFLNNYIGIELVVDYLRPVTVTVKEKIED